MDLSQHQHRRHREIRSAREGARIALGQQRRKAPNDYFDARTQRLSLYCGNLQQSHRSLQDSRRRPDLQRSRSLLGRRKMIRLLRRSIDQIRGTGEASVTIPSMDGAFRPNSFLDEAQVVANIEAPDNLIHDGTRTLLSSGSALLALEEAAKTSARQVISEFESSISALAAHPSGILAIGLDDGRIKLR